MIGYLTGKIISSKPTQIILDVSGVGYLVNISISTFEKISDKDIVSLFIHTSVKEDSITLFGFFTQSEKEMFELLISISGIGPKVSLGILSGISVDDLKDAIANGNVSRLIAIPGIGRKTAERVVLELRNKVDAIKADGAIRKIWCRRSKKTTENNDRLRWSKCCKTTACWTSAFCYYW